MLRITLHVFIFVFLSSLLSSEFCSWVVRVSFYFVFFWVLFFVCVFLVFFFVLCCLFFRSVDTASSSRLFHVKRLHLRVSFVFVIFWVLFFVCLFLVSFFELCFSCCFHSGDTSSSSRLCLLCHLLSCMRFFLLCPLLCSVLRLSLLGFLLRSMVFS